MSDLFFGEFSTDVTPPEVTSPSPGSGDSGVLKGAAVAFTLTDSETGVDFDNLIVTVGGVTVYDWNGAGVREDGFQTPTYDGTITDLGGGVWRFELSTHPDFASYSNVEVTVDAQDLAPVPNVMVQYVWDFDVIDYEAPYVDVGWSPTGINIPTAALIEFDLKDDGWGVDLTTVTVTVGGVLAYHGFFGGFQDGFDGGSSAVTGDPSSYHFVIDADPDYAEFTAYEVVVNGKDLDPDAQHVAVFDDGAKEHESFDGWSGILQSFDDGTAETAVFDDGAATVDPFDNWPA